MGIIGTSVAWRTAGAVLTVAATTATLTASVIAKHEQDIAVQAAIQESVKNGFDNLVKAVKGTNSNED